MRKDAPNYFGEVALFCKSKRTADVVAINFCTVECITRTQLNQVCDTYEGMGQRLKSNVSYKVIYKQSTIDSIKMYPLFRELTDAQLSDINECIAEVCLEEEDELFWLVNEPNCLIYIW